MASLSELDGRDTLPGVRFAAVEGQSMDIVSPEVS
jgi:hypothetical protein